MKTGIVGGGILGTVLGHRLATMGHQVELFEAAPALGGLAAAHDYGPFWWDRFYHVILPTDRHLVSLVKELGLAADLRWRKTGTGYYAHGTFHDMNGNADFLKFPLLNLLDKARLAAAVLYATRVADPWKLYQVTAEAWLTKVCGRRAYETFWRPLLRAKFGPFHDRIAAVFIWATLTRLFGARSSTTSEETMGYVRGGYRTVLAALEKQLAERGARVHLSTPVREVRREGGDVTIDGKPFDQVFFTAPSRLAREVCDAQLMPVVERAENDWPTSKAYLGVACLVLALRRTLVPYYVLNIGDEDVEATGVIEMTNLVDRDENTAGLHLVYVPQYLDSEDSRLVQPDGLDHALMNRGVRRLFPDLTDADVVYRGLHRARYVQPLPLVREEAAQREQFPQLSAPFTVLNTSMLTCATLNNNEVVGLVNRFIDENRMALRG